MKNHFEYRALHLETPHFNQMNREIGALLKAQKSVAIISFPENPDDYVEPSKGQCIALKAKNKVLLLEQQDGSYLHLAVGEQNRIHRCPVSKEALEQFLTDTIRKHS